MFGVWVESVDPVDDLRPTNQFLYRTVQSGTAEKPLNSRYEEITVMTDKSHIKYNLANIFLISSCSKTSSISSSRWWLQELPM